MTLSLSNKAAEQGLVYDERAFLVQKNTFFEVVHVPLEKKQRKASSVPPSVKFERCHLCRAKDPLPRASSLSEASTCCDSNGWDTDSDAGEPVVPSFSDSQTKDHQKVPLALCELITAPPLAQPRQRLSTSAKAFVSKMTTLAQHKFRLQVEAIFAVTQAAMASHGVTVEVRPDPVAAGWSVDARVASGCVQVPGDILNNGRVALLKAVDRSTSVSCLGYMANPVVPTPGGFKVVLCDMEDESAACWDMYSGGHCQRGCRCKWSHPKLQITVTVRLIGAIVF